MLDDPVVASPPGQRTRVRDDGSDLRVAAAACAGLAGLLNIPAIFLATQRIIIFPAPAEDVRFIGWTKLWVTGRTAASGGGFTDPAQSSSGTWPNWLLVIVAIAALLTAAIVIAAGRGRLIALAVGLVAAGIGWAVTELLSVVGQRTGDVGGGADMEVTLLAGWWFVLASAVMGAVALVLVWWSGRAGRAGRPADAIPAD